MLSLVTILAACGDSTTPPATSSPTSTSEPTPTPTPDPNATATPTPSTHSLLYRELGSVSDTIWRFDPTNPDDRQNIATIDHSEGVGIRASVSPQRDAVAYITLPAGRLDEETESQAFVLPIGGSPQMLADGVDLLSTPLWSPDGGSLYLRRNSAAAISIVKVDMQGGEESELVSVNRNDVFGLFPIGLSNDSQTLYYAQIASDLSTSFLAYGLTSGGSSLLVQASPQIARDYDLSADGSRIAFISSGRAFIADLDTAIVTAVESDLLSGSEQRQPVWRPNGSLALGQLPLDNEPSPAVVIDPATGQGSTLASPDSGFDAPLEWSPDGQFLAVQTISGTSAQLTVANQDQRLSIAEGPDFLSIGWI